MQRLFTLLRALFYACGFFLLWGWLAVSVQRYDPRLGIELPSWAWPVGYVLLTAGALLAAACVGWFAVAGQGTPAPFDAPRRFVARGPYRFVRNPMYWGGFGIIAGYGLIRLSASVLLLSLFMLACAHTFVVLYEERALEAQFGEEYREYKRKVNRWLPSATTPSAGRREREANAGS